MISSLRAFLLLVALAGGAWAAAPVLSGPDATAGANGTATLKVTVTPNGADTTVTFAYGLTTNYGAAKQATVESGDGTRTVTVALTGLIGGQTYHFRVLASNADGTATPTDDRTFIEPAYKPKLTLLPVTHAASGVVTLRALVTANGTAGTAVFQYGLTTSYGSETTPTTAVAAKEIDFSVTGTIPAAPGNPLNNFRLVIKDADGAIIAQSANAKSNTNPKAVADSYTLPDAEPLTLEVLENDSDAEGDALKITNVTTPRYGTATIADGDLEILYTPSGALLVDTFRYTIEDGFGGKATAMVTIRPLRATLVGTHGGLIRTTEGKEIGYFRISATELGSFTGVVVIDGTSYLLSGVFAADGSFHGAASRDGTIMPVDLTTVLGENGTTIQAQFAQGKYAASVEFTDDEAETRGPLAGRYTVELPGSGGAVPTDDGAAGNDGTVTTPTNGTTLPEGTGWTALKVGEDGSVRVKGRLPDGRSFSTKGALVVGPDGPQITFYDELRDTRVIGTFDVGDTVTGSFRVDRDRSDDEFFPAGYDTTLTVNGARYVPVDDGGGVVSSDDNGVESFTISFSGGGLPGTLTRNVQLTDSDQFKVLNGGPEELKIKVNPSDGRFTTKTTVTDDGKKAKGTGVFIQASSDSTGGNGAGVFKGPDKKVGRIQITAGSTPTPTIPIPTPSPTPGPLPTPVGNGIIIQPPNGIPADVR